MNSKIKCPCGKQAKLTTGDMQLDLGISAQVTKMPMHQCECGEEFYPMTALRLASRRLFVMFIHERVLNPERIRFMRKTMGLTQQKLSDHLGLSGKSLIAKYESGAERPQPSTVQALGLFMERWVHIGWKLPPVAIESPDPNPFRLGTGICPALDYEELTKSQSRT